MVVLRLNESWTKSIIIPKNLFVDNFIFMINLVYGGGNNTYVYNLEYSFKTSTSAKLNLIYQQKWTDTTAKYFRIFGIK